MNSTHVEYMNRALHLAMANMGVSSPNPSVGAVIVQNGTIIAEGVTEEAGKRHGEIVALDAIGRKMPEDALLYVTLEPCSHYGRTPPCTEAIIASGAKKVVIPLLDPNPQVAGNGFRKLKEAGIEVILLEVSSSKAADLIRPFKKGLFQKKPFILHKSAMTMDGKTAADSGHSKWISSAQSRLLAHRVRARMDAVIVGKGTYEGDNPRLNVRLDDFDREVTESLCRSTSTIQGYDSMVIRGLLSRDFTHKREPLKVIVGLPENMTPHDAIFQTGRTLVYARKDEVEKRGTEKNLKGIPIVTMDCSKDESVDYILRDLYSRGITYGMVEGGSRLAGAFHDAGEIDQVLYITAPIVAGSGVPVIQGKRIDSLEDGAHYVDITRFISGDDIVTSAYKEKYDYKLPEG